VSDEGPFPHESALENFVDGETDSAGREHDQRNLQALVAVDEGQREHEGIPDDAVTKPARRLEVPANAGVLHTAVEPPTESIFGGVEP